MQIENVDGRPYLITQYVTSSTDDPDAPYYFSIYTPSEKGPNEWDRRSRKIWLEDTRWGLFQVKPEAPRAQPVTTPTTAATDSAEPGRKFQGDRKSKPGDTPAIEPKECSDFTGNSARLRRFDVVRPDHSRPPVSSPHHVAFDWQPLYRDTEWNAVYVR